MWVLPDWRVCGLTGTGELHWAGTGGAGVAVRADPACPDVVLVAALLVAGTDATDW